MGYGEKSGERKRREKKPISGDKSGESERISPRRYAHGDKSGC